MPHYRKNSSISFILHKKKRQTKHKLRLWNSNGRYKNLFNSLEHHHVSSSFLTHQINNTKYMFMLSLTFDTRKYQTNMKGTSWEGVGKTFGILYSFSVSLFQVSTSSYILHIVLIVICNITEESLESQPLLQ